MAFCVYGWTYVNLVTLKRKDPFTSGNGGHQDFKTLLMTAPILFLASGVIAMRSRHDLSGYCSTSSEASGDFDGHKTHILRATNAEDQQNQEVLDCHEYTDDEIFDWNFSYWT
jgi:hypothetical protein